MRYCWGIGREAFRNHHPTMTSADIKAAYAAAGIKVRIRNFTRNFRVCTVNSTRFDHVAAAAVAASLGCTDVLGRPGCNFNQPHELFAYKPGAIVRI
jgi:hypothetical protein